MSASSAGTCTGRWWRARGSGKRSGRAARGPGGSLAVLAARISDVGELGWELDVPMEEGARLWDTIWTAGQPSGLIPAGIGVYGTTGRLEKGYRAFGNELTGDF